MITPTSWRRRVVAAPLLLSACLTLSACRGRQEAAVEPPPAEPSAVAQTEAREEIAWFEGSVEEAFAAAEAQSKPLFLYWGAAWCPPCHYLKTKVFHEPGFVAKSRDFVAVYLDGDTERAQTWGEELEVSGYPTVLVMSPAGDELVRVPNGLGPEQYAAVLDRAKAMTEPVDAVFKAVLEAGPAAATPEQLAILAYHDWDLDARVQLEEGKALEIFHRLWKETPAAQEAVKARFLSEYLETLHGARSDALAEDPPAEAPILAAEDVAEVERQVGAILADEALRSDNLGLVDYWSQETIDLLHPDLGEARETLIRAWVDAAKAVGADESLTVDDRLTALYPQLVIARLGLPPTPTPPAAAEASAAAATPVAEALPPELVAHIREQVAWAEGAVTDPGEWQAVASTMIWLLDEIGAGDESARLLETTLGKTAEPHYYMSYLADRAAEAGDPAKSVEWSRKAWQATPGRASHFQWGYEHIANLVDQTPDDAEAIQADATTVLDAILADGDAFANRNHARMDRLQSALEGWNEDGAHQAEVDALREHVLAACPRFEAEGEDSPRSRCEAFLAPAGAD